MINDIDILNEFRIDKQMHYGIDSSIFLAQKNKIFNGNILLGICNCKTLGGSDILVNIHSFNDFIIWDVFNSIYPSEYDTFIFKKNEYKNSVKLIKKNIKHNLNNAYKWAWMLRYSNEDLEEKLIESK